MKLLFDQNLSFKLVPALLTAFPGSKHLKDFSLTRELDEPIWSFAGKNGFTIVSKDTDFMHLALLRGHAPKVVAYSARQLLNQASHTASAVGRADHQGVHCRSERVLSRHRVGQESFPNKPFHATVWSRA